jgi:hypothetical protein
MIDGRREWLWSAEFHYFRLPQPDLWRDQLSSCHIGVNGGVYFLVHSSLRVHSSAASSGVATLLGDRSAHLS